MSRLEDDLRGYDPPLHPPGLADSDVAYSLHDTELGQLVVAVDAAGRAVACSYDDEGTVAARLARRLSPRVLRDPPRCDHLRRELDEYLSGRRHHIDLVVDPVLADPFARRVLDAVRRVPYGATTDYGTLAAAIGNPASARAVGNALGANPLCIIIPCHRVLRRDGTLGGYAGGAPAKRALLNLEQAGAAGAPEATGSKLRS